MKLVRNKELKRRKDRKESRFKKSMEIIINESIKERNKTKEEKNVVSIRITKEVKEMLNVIANLDEKTNGKIFEELVKEKYEKIYSERIEPLLKELDNNKDRMVHV